MSSFDSFQHPFPLPKCLHSKKHHHDEMSEKNTGDFIAKCCLFFTFHDITATDATFLFIDTKLEIKYFRFQKYLLTNVTKRISSLNHNHVSCCLKLLLLLDKSLSAFQKKTCIIYLKYKAYTFRLDVEILTGNPKLS